MIDINKTLEIAGKEMDRLKDAEVVVKLPLVKAMTLMSLVQLSLRHPEADKETAEAMRVGRQFCDELIDIIGRSSPKLADFCRLGDNPKYDQPPALGATGKFPDGKLADSDEGALKLAVTHHKGNVVINFGTTVKWFAMLPNQAKVFAALIAQHADELLKK